MSILSNLDPKTVLAECAIVGAALVGVYFWGHHKGFAEEKAAYDLFVAQQGQKAEAQVAANSSALLFQQTKFQLDQTKLQKDHDNEVQTLTSARDDALRNGNLYAQRLRDYLRTHTGQSAAAVPGSASSAGQPAAEGQSAGGLSDGVSSLNWYLTQRFHTADVNAATLNEAIDLIAKDRETCNGSLPGVTQK